MMMLELLMMILLMKIPVMTVVMIMRKMWKKPLPPGKKNFI